MPDKGKVIKGLNQHCNGSMFDRCDECPYYKFTNEQFECRDELMADAYALLKEQEAKCLTKAELDDLDENQFVWIEGRTGYLDCLQIIGICREKTGVSDIQFNAPTSYVEISTNTYGKSYRIWTDKPTEEQSQAVKWDENRRMEK